MSQEGNFQPEVKVNSTTECGIPVENLGHKGDVAGRIEFIEGMIGRGVNTLDLYEELDILTRALKNPEEIFGQTGTLLGRIQELEKKERNDEEEQEYQKLKRFELSK